jgi:hypothetical protein
MINFIKNNIAYILTSAVIAAIIGSLSALTILGIHSVYHFEKLNIILAASAAISYVASLYLSNWIYRDES